MLLLATGLLNGCKGNPDTVTIYVSPQGNDANAGFCASKPLASIRAARDLVRQMKREQAPMDRTITVVLDGGVYELPQTLRLDNRDSGQPDSPVVYRAAPGKTVTLTGARRVNDYRLVTDPETLARFPDESIGNVFMTTFEPERMEQLFGTENMDISDRQAQWPLPELLQEGRMLPMASWPADGWCLIADVPCEEYVYSQGVVKRGKDCDRFGYEEDFISTWKHNSDLYVHGFWMYDWWHSYLNVARINPSEKTVIIRGRKSRFGYRRGQRYRFINLPEAMDREGTWCFLRDERTVYFRPFTPQGPLYMTENAEPLIETTEAAHIVFENLTFEGGRNCGMKVQDCRDILIRNCVVRNMAGDGIRVHGGQRVRIVSCEVTGCGLGGISMQGGVRETLTPCGHEALANHIHSNNRLVLTGYPGIRMNGVGIRAAHNLIHDLPHTGIQFNGNNHIIEYNELHDLCDITQDVGAIYGGRDWTERGNVIRYNYLHDLGSFGKLGSVGVYLDDLLSGVQIYGNLFERVHFGVLIGGGRDNFVANNIFSRTKYGVHLDSRGTTWANERITRRTGGSWDLFAKLESMPYQSELWAKAYPKLPDILDEDPLKPRRNEIVRNVWYDPDRKGSFLHLTAGGKKSDLTMENNFLEGDPGLADTENGFDFRHDSAVWQTGFEPIPFEKIGPAGFTAN